MRKAAEVQIAKMEVLSDNWYLLRKATIDIQRSDGSWQRVCREVYDRGNGATILLYNLARRTVVLIRQFRLPAYLNEHDGMLIETPAGLLDNATPEARIRAEVEEETGYHLGTVHKVFEAFMSPGSVTEKLHFFMAEYTESERRGAGGGLVEEGEDIETLELAIEEALAMIARGEIMDGKTIMLLQYAALHLFPDCLRSQRQPAA
ncbi:NUDIX domain-containing protein [Chitinimonas sp.]|uniref:NUDIX domain-containing protein n=1 Tax=Chitinimonas sp. TaxID=1934313 RepID=UPI0035B1DB7E